MLDVDTRPLDLETSAPFGIARWTHSRFENYVVTLKADDGTVGQGEAAPNRRYGEDAASVRAMLKLPTGNPDIATGSGNIDWSLGALYQRQITPHVRAYANLDWVFTGKPDWPNIRHQDEWITNWIAEYAISHRTALLAQYRTNRNPLRIGSTQSDKDSQELILGFNHRLEHRVVWSGGFIEDINPETAPDWTMTTDFKWEF